ncbi:CoB--CoM heterodisulfide reductase iron-sulfur subunit A family protein [candidate division KSB1 bacterium]|nr:CoB--CoM heterodisulfide reductase iron-sulfur subunit A family protein [candidate division KSB1 bacterium]
MGGHQNVNILAYSEVESLKGDIGNFTATVRKKARYVDEDICNACGDCLVKCPVKKIPDGFDMGLKNRKAVYQYFSQGIPAVMTIDPDNCIYLKKGKCGVCKTKCVKGAIDYEQKDKILELDVGAVIVATGLDVFDPTPLTQYGYGKMKNVITGLEYERLINATGPTGGNLLRPSDGEMAHKVAYVQCVGSRDFNYCNYCSSVCCMYAIKDAMLGREHEPDSESYIFHTDFRNVGKWFQKYEIRGKEEYGINYIRGRVADITEDENQNPILWYEDTETREVKSLNVEMAVLSTAAMAAKGSSELAKKLGVNLSEHGFVAAGLPYPSDTNVPGIFACGFCIGPADIPESVAQASAAANRAAEVVFLGEKKKTA